MTGGQVLAVLTWVARVAVRVAIIWAAIVAVLGATALATWLLRAGQENTLHALVGVCTAVGLG